MKKLKRRYIATILVLIFVPMILVGCKSGNDTSSSNKSKKELSVQEESVDIILKIILKKDKSQIDTIGLDENVYNNVLNVVESYMKDFVSYGAEDYLTEDIEKELTDSFYKGFEKIDYDLELESQEENTAEVKVSMKGLSANKIMEELSDKKLDTSNLDSQEAAKKSFEAVSEIIAEGPLVDESESATVTVKKLDSGKWLIDVNDLYLLINLILSSQTA